MAKFITKVFIFLLIGGISIIPICRLFNKIYENAICSDIFHFEPRTTILVVGDSHVATAVNSAILKSSVNISLNGENYFYTYYKLKHFLKLNPQINTVVMGFSPHNVMKSCDLYTYDNKANRWQMYLPVLDDFSREKIACLKMSYVVPFLQYRYGAPFRLFQDSVVFRSLLRQKYQKYDFAFYGGFEERSGNNLKPTHIAWKVASHFVNENGSYTGISDDMIHYLGEIAALCQAKGVRLVLFGAPLEKQYRSGMPQQAMIDYMNVKQEITTRYGNIRFLDLSSLDIPESFYYDCDHMNRDGARVVSEILFRELRGKKEGLNN